MKEEKEGMPVDTVAEVEREMEGTKEVEENTEETAVSIIQGFNEMTSRSKTHCNVFTNIQDQKKIFNLDSNVDCLLNDCEGESIRVKEVLIKRFEKPMKNPIINEETGEIEKDVEISMSCILIDDNNKSYATGSKIFTIKMIQYIQMFGITKDGFEIKIIKTKMNEGKALGFELL